jgi:hypothetical protein
MLKNVKLERAYAAPTRMEITIMEDGQAYVNIMSLNEEDAGTAITAALVGVADQLDLPIRALSKMVNRELWKVIAARKILGVAQQVASAGEPEKARVIEIVAH